MSDKFKVKAHFSQIADTGDYDGDYEITNGKISIFCADDPEEEKEGKALIEALNNCGLELYLDTNAEFGLQLEQSENNRLNQVIERMKYDAPICPNCGINDRVEPYDGLKDHCFNCNESFYV